MELCVRRVRSKVSGVFAAVALAAYGGAIADERVERAQAAYQDGRFADAEALFAELARESPREHSHRLRLGELGLLRNRLDEAERELSRAVELRADESAAQSLLAEVFHRRDVPSRAAALLGKLGRKAQADMFASFGAGRTYEMAGTPRDTTVEFVQTDPLPLISARINGHEEIFLLIDTGGGELILDPALADSLGVARFGKSAGIFAGGGKGELEHAKVDSVTIGDCEVRNVPVNLIDTSKFSAIGGGRRVGGVLGAIFLYHFRATLDYPGGKLVLGRRGGQPVAAADTATRVPFWLAADHLIVARGRVNQHETMLLVDTGLAGGGFACPQSTIERAGIKLSGQSLEGQGGAGKVSVRPFVLSELALGERVRKNITGFAGAFPESVEHACGFRIGGLVSHGFFRDSRVTFDFERMEMIIEGR
jgi:predicted aspartyl protease